VFSKGVAALFALTAVCAASPTYAQPALAPASGPPAPANPTAPPASPTSNIPPQPISDHIVAGTLVELELTQAISTKIVKPGDLFTLRLAAPVMLGSQVVIPVGTTGVGQVVDAGRAGIGGKPAKLVLAARHLDLPGRQVGLRGLRFGATGQDNTDTVMAVALIPYVGIMGFLIKGGDVEIPPGARAIAKRSADFTPLAEDAQRPAAQPLAPPAAPLVSAPPVRPVAQEASK
jgi:hypothetical protein